MNPNEQVPVFATVEEIEAGLLDKRIDDLITITGDKISKKNKTLCEAATLRLAHLIKEGELDDREEALKEFASNYLLHVNISRLRDPSIDRLKIINEMKAEEEEKQAELENMTLADFLAQSENDKESDK